MEFEASLSKTREGSLIADINRHVKEKVRSVSLKGLLDGIYYGVENAVMHSGKIDSEGDVECFIQKAYDNEQAKNGWYNNFTSYPEANKYKIAKGLKKIYEGKIKLSDADKVCVGVNDDFKPVSEKFYFPRAVEELFAEEKESFPSQDILIVRRPDYVGNSKWDFISLKRGDKPVSARILHQEWLKEWKSHEKQLFPGDALLVMIKITKITFKNRSVRFEDEVTEVLDIIPQKNVSQRSLELRK